MPHHRVELRDRETHSAITHEAQHGSLAMRDLGTERQSQPESHRTQKSVVDVAPGRLLPDDFIQPVIRLRAIANDNGVWRQALSDGSHRLVRMNASRRVGVLLAM